MDTPTTSAPGTPREEFIKAMLNLLASKPDANIMLILEDQNGLLTMQSVPSIIWGFGVIVATEKMMDERYRYALNQADEETQKRVQAAQEELATALSPDTRRSN